MAKIPRYQKWGEEAGSIPLFKTPLVNSGAVIPSLVMHALTWIQTQLSEEGDYVLQLCDVIRTVQPLHGDVITAYLASCDVTKAAWTTRSVSPVTCVLLSISTTSVAYI